jgi:hypothetical protein
MAQPGVLRRVLLPLLPLLAPKTALVSRAIRARAK